MVLKWLLAHLVTLSVLASLAIASVGAGEYILAVWFVVVFCAHVYAAEWSV